MLLNVKQILFVCLPKKELTEHFLHICSFSNVVCSFSSTISLVIGCSKGKNAHIPYRDSKLTRILQNSLGGNARTAIICTMSPARSHVEQSRNTLLFASCAKEVTTSAQVNVVMSDKALVKQLQRELARLEGEMKSIESTSSKRDSVALLKEKELMIEKMESEIRELTQQRDIAQSRVDNLLQSIGEDQALRLDDYQEVESIDMSNSLNSDVGLGTPNNPKNVVSTPKFVGLSVNSEDNFLLDNSTPQFVGLDPCQGWDEIPQKAKEESEGTCNEVQCVEMEESSINRKTESDVLLPGPEEKEGKVSTAEPIDEAAVLSPEESSTGKLSMTGATGEVAVSSSPQKKDKESSIDKDETYDALKQKIQELQKTISYLVSLYPMEQSPASSEDVSTCRSSKLSKSASCKAALVSIPASPALEKAEHYENIPITWSNKNVSGRPEGFCGKLSDSKYNTKIGNLTRKDSQTSISAASMETQSIKESDAEDASSIYDHSENTSSLWFEKAIHTPTNMSENNFPARAARRLSDLQYSSEFGKIFKKDYEISISSASIGSRSIKESDTEDSGVHQFSGHHEMVKLESPKKFGEYLVRTTITCPPHRFSLCIDYSFYCLDSRANYILLLST